MADEFVNFEKALSELQMDKEQLMRMVSNGEIRAVRGENNSIRFKPDEVERLKQSNFGGSDSFSEDTLDDDELFGGSGDLALEEEGMATAQISSSDTLISPTDSGDPIGMSTAPIDPPVAPVAPPVVTPRGGRRRSGSRPTSGGGAKPAATGAARAQTATTGVRRTTGRSTRMRQVDDEAASAGIGMGMVASLVLGFLISCFSLFFWWDTATAGNPSPNATSGVTRPITDWTRETFTELPSEDEIKASALPAEK